MGRANGGGADDEEEEEEDQEEEAVSPETMDRAAVAKRSIGNYYRTYWKTLHERKERRGTLERKLAASNVSEEEQLNLLRDLERKETEFIRLRRLKISVDDFELLTIIGRGASGEVRLCREKSTGNIFAMKKLRKSEMLRRGELRSLGHL